MKVENTSVAYYLVCGKLLGFGLMTNVESFSNKPKGRSSASATAPSKGLGTPLSKTKRANQFLESLKAEGKVILEDVQPSVGQSRAAAGPPMDPIMLTVEEKLNMAMKRDGAIEIGDNSGILFKTLPNITQGVIF